jgi:hypothetical protein
MAEWLRRGLQIRFRWLKSAIVRTFPDLFHALAVMERMFQVLTGVCDVGDNRS